MGNPCQNGASCLPIYDRDEYECVCLPGYTGQHCNGKPQFHYVSSPLQPIPVTSICVKIGCWLKIWPKTFITFTLLHLMKSNVREWIDQFSSLIRLLPIFLPSWYCPLNLLGDLLKCRCFLFCFLFFLFCLFVCFINKRICLIPKFALTGSKQTKSRDLSQFRIPDFHHQRFQNLDQKPAIARLLSLLILREQWVW